MLPCRRVPEARPGTVHAARTGPAFSIHTGNAQAKNQCAIIPICFSHPWFVAVAQFPAAAANSRAALTAVSVGLGGLVGVGPSSKPVPSNMMLNQDHSFSGENLLAALGNPTLETQVRHILARNDLSEQRKVELIANLIKPSSTLPPGPS
jgi:hypothetical protein